MAHNNYISMKILSNKFIGICLVFVGLLVSLNFYNSLPATLVSHWGLYGEPNGYSSKNLALFIMPVISIFLYGLFLFLPKLDPLKKNIETFREQFNFFVNFIIAFLLYLHILTIFWNLGYEFNFVTFMSPAFAVLSYSIGALLEKAKRNWFVGIRTPWTLSNDTVWDKTHKLGSKLYKYAAIFPLLGIILSNLAFFLTIVPLVGVSLFLVVYSYLEFKKI